MASEELHPRERWFEDWAVGDSFVGEITYAMEHDRMIEFAEEFDPQSFHTDPQAATGSFFGGLIASGWHTAAASMRLVADFLGPASMGAPGIDDLRWHRPVRDGDELRLTWTILEHRRSASKPDRGIMRVQQNVHDQAGELVMSMIAIMMIACRSAADAATDAPPVQTLADQVRATLPLLLPAAFDRFLDDHEDETFYSFALLFNAAAPAVELAANTEEAFAPTLQRYQENENWGHRYHFEEGIRSLRYNVGDWSYNAFASLELFNLDYEDDDDGLWTGSWEQDTIEALSEVLIWFRKSDSFARMRKTPGFVSFAIGQEPDYLGAMERMHRVSYSFENASDSANR